MKPPTDGQTTKLLLNETVDRMRTWLDRGLRCINQLSDAQLWYRPNATSNAIGNLVLHLVGNLRQWILGGIDNQPDTRDRPVEFSTAAGMSKSQLRILLEETVEQSCKVIEEMPPGRVAERRTIQNMDVTLANAIVMAVSHLGLHVGQIQYVSKMLLSDAYVGTSEPDPRQK